MVNTATNEPVVQMTDSAGLFDTAGNQITLRKSLPPEKLVPGVYQVTIKVNDLVSRQSISSSAKFAVQ